MSQELEKLPEYQETIRRLDAVKHMSPEGKDYWLARQIHGVLGYPTWARFEDVIDRAMTACAGARLPVPNHFAQTSKMMEVGRGAQRPGNDFFLSRMGCHVAGELAGRAADLAGQEAACWQRRTAYCTRS